MMNKPFLIIDSQGNALPVNPEEFKTICPKIDVNKIIVTESRKELYSVVSKFLNREYEDEQDS